jgi:D-inositol-3-phosphate glycosyltransferase
MMLRIAMLSLHSSPMGRMGTRDTGGMSVYVRELARELGRRGHQVDIFTRSETSRVMIPWPNVRIVFVGVKGSEKASKSALLDYASAFTEVIDRFRTDGRIAYDMIHSNYWLSGVVGEHLKTRWGCPHTMTFHTLGAAKTAARAGHTEQGLRMAEETRLVQSCEGLIAPTQEERERLISLYGGRAEKIHVIPCGVDLALFKPRFQTAGANNHRPARGSPRLLFVGRFDPMKGIERLLHSLVHLSSEPAATLSVIGGDGPASSAHRRIAELAGTLGLAARVRFLGTVSHRMMPRHYQAADAVVVASAYESFGLVILEALASGTPVATTPVGIAPHLIQAGVNGYMAQNGDDQSLADAIRRTLTPAGRWDPMRIRETVVGFGWPRLASMLTDAYHRMLSITLNGSPS